ncbi:hypothetical protein [Spongiactinospora sp. TRM90649]|uniref:hypothetical protein n=1 Tax=Spongiactinospora sp. TRM90649 TaxID=3031114 RepID=UPI0023F88760|nr:hypothetical protein [Spongiactinospora sp. TRM90649]MDF5758030.1 hypothetical protein [Spongiactinospora sp. TRM90649]
MTRPSGQGAALFFQEDAFGAGADEFQGEVVLAAGVGVAAQAAQLALQEGDGLPVGAGRHGDWGTGRISTAFSGHALASSMASSRSRASIS